MMPGTVALARFVESSYIKEGWPALRTIGEEWYPFWYLGVPFRYLGGPVVPLLLSGLHHFLPKLTLFDLYFLLTAFFWLFGGVSLSLLVKKLGQKTAVAFLAGLVFLIGPYLPFLFPYTDSLYLIGFSFLPLILFFYFEILKKWSVRKGIFLSVLIGLVLLISNLILPALLVGMLSLYLPTASWGSMEKQLKRTAVILAMGFVFATFWYGPYYWFHLWSVPSFAGKGLGSVASLLIKLGSALIPILLATFSVKQFRKRDNLLFNFAFFWFFIFGFLTLMRFLSDPDFWQDWSGYALELQMGGAILLAIMINWLLQASRRPVILRTLFLSGLVVALVLPWIFAPQKFLGLRKDIQNSAEERLGSWLAENVKSNERVYLSGTDAFWLNAFFDVSQLRGGVDQGATHPFWAKASYEIREGTDGKLAVNWLKALGISYLVVHEKESADYYHDFKQPEKFKKTSDLTEVLRERGEVVYKVKGASPARAVNLKAFEELKMPKDGENRPPVSAYVNQFVRPLEVMWLKPNEILLRGEIKAGEGISLAVTYDPRWKGIVSGQKSELKKEKDILGNLLLMPEYNGSFEIRLRYN